MVPTAKGRGSSAGAPEARAATAQILRWALFEGAALFGCVVVLMAGLSGVVPDQPVYYANLAGVLVFLVVVWRDLGRMAAATRGAE